MGDVIVMDGWTKLDIPANRVLEGAIDELDTAIVVGYDKDGNEYFATSIASIGDMLLILERAQKALLDYNDGS